MPRLCPENSAGSCWFTPANATQIPPFRTVAIQPNRRIMGTYAVSSRRSFLAQLTGLGIAAVLPSRGATSILAEIPRRAALYFFEQADPETGLVRDRARVTGVDDRRIASIAATGFEPARTPAVRGMEWRS